MNPAPPITRTLSMDRSPPRAFQYRRDRPHQDLEVQPKRPVVDVFQIHPHPLVEAGDAVPSVHLPETGQPRRDAQPAPVPQLVSLYLRSKRGAWSDEAHISLQDAP